VTAWVNRHTPAAAPRQTGVGITPVCSACAAVYIGFLAQAARYAGPSGMIGSVKTDQHEMVSKPLPAPCGTP